MARVLVGLCLIALAGCGGELATVPSPPTALPTATTVGATAIVPTSTAVPSLNAAIAALPPEQSDAARDVLDGVTMAVGMGTLVDRIRAGEVPSTSVAPLIAGTVQTSAPLMRRITTATQAPATTAMGCTSGLALVTMVDGTAMLGAISTAPDDVPRRQAMLAPLSHATTAALEAWAFGKPQPTVPPNAWSLATTMLSPSSLPCPHV